MKKSLTIILSIVMGLAIAVNVSASKESDKKAEEKKKQKTEQERKDKEQKEKHDNAEREKAEANRKAREAEEAARAAHEQKLREQEAANKAAKERAERAEAAAKAAHEKKLKEEAEAAKAKREKEAKERELKNAAKNAEERHQIELKLKSEQAKKEQLEKEARAEAKWVAINGPRPTPKPTPTPTAPPTPSPTPSPTPTATPLAAATPAYSAQPGFAYWNLAAPTSAATTHEKTIQEILADPKLQFAILKTGAKNLVDLEKNGLIKMPESWGMGEFSKSLGSMGDALTFADAGTSALHSLSYIPDMFKNGVTAANSWGLMKDQAAAEATVQKWALLKAAPTQVQIGVAAADIFLKVTGSPYSTTSVMAQTNAIGKAVMNPLTNKVAVDAIVSTVKDWNDNPLKYYQGNDIATQAVRMDLQSKAIAASLFNPATSQKTWNAITGTLAAAFAPPATQKPVQTPRPTPKAYAAPEPSSNP